MAGARLPYCADKPTKKASSKDPATWSDFATAYALVQSGAFPMLGFMLDGSGLVGIDLDHCVERLVDVDDETFVIAPWALDIIQRINSYAEISVSGTGIHVIACGSKPEGRCRTGKKGRGVVPVGSEVEIYDSGRLFVVTGRVVPPTILINERTAEIAALHAELFAERSHDTRDIADLTDEELVAKIRASKSGAKFGALWDGDTSAYQNDESAADMALCLMLAFWTRKDRDRMDRLFRQSKLVRPKWERADYRDATVRKACEQTKSVYRLRMLTMEDFVAYLPTHRYYCLTTREFWSPISVDQHADAPKDDQSASEWLDFNRHVEQMTWWPGKPTIIENAIFAEGSLLPRTGWSILNTYRPPEPTNGDPSLAGPWIDLVRKVYSGEADHLLAWFAHRVQCPHEKVNHALVLGGSQGIGKDTILDPVRYGVGTWNTHEIRPKDVMERFNGYVKSVLLRISEVHDLGDVSRYAFYDRVKTLIATPPESFRVDEKHIPEHHVPNLLGLVMTTNYLTNGMYLDPDDRRHHVSWSKLTKEDFTEDYWRELYAWYEAGGRDHVVAFLKTFDLNISQTFSAKGRPPRTEAWQAIVDANRSPEDSEIADIIDNLGKPVLLTLDDLVSNALTGEFGLWLGDRKNRRRIPHRLEACGYVKLANPYADDTLWKVPTSPGSKAKTRQAVYGRRDASDTIKLKAARVLCESGRVPAEEDVSQRRLTESGL